MIKKWKLDEERRKKWHGVECKIRDSMGNLVDAKINAHSATHGEIKSKFITAWYTWDAIEDVMGKEGVFK